MTFLLWVFQIVLLVVVTLLSPFIVAVWVLLRLPIPWWMNTPDDPDPLKQGLYEPQVAAILAKYGQAIKTWYWLGVRNQMNGLFYRLAAQAPTGCEPTFSSKYPQTKNPYVSGSCKVLLTLAGRTYWEWSAVGAWSTTKCWQVRFGYKIAEMSFPGPLLPTLTIRPFITIDSTT